MKPLLKISILLLITIIFYSTVWPANKIKEEVSVTYVEVPVRIFYKGQPVSHLNKEDFILYENGRKQEIKNLQEFTQVMEDKKGPDPGTGETPVTDAEQRYFVLIFRISQYNDELDKAVDLVLKKILRKSDEVLIFINNSSLHLTDLKNLSAHLPKIKEIMKAESRKAYMRMNDAIKKIEHMGAQYLQIWTDYPQTIFAIQDYLRTWLQTWKEYKLKFLVPELSYFFNFARHLEKINKKKWVINFYQMELFPRLKEHGDLRRKIVRAANTFQATAPEFAKLINQDLNLLDKEMSVAKDIPTEEVSKLFYKVNATFHSILIPTMMNQLSRDSEYKKISTDIENSLRDITKKTGGVLLSTPDISSALDTISNSSSHYYILTYEPADPEKKGQIKIKAKNKKYKVIYDNNFRKDYINEYFEKVKVRKNEINIRELEFRKGNLNFILSGCLPGEDGKPAFKKIRVLITLYKNKIDVVSSFNNLLTPLKDKIRISIPLKNIPEGSYIAEVKLANLAGDTISLKKTEIKK